MTTIPAPQSWPSSAIRAVEQGADVAAGRDAFRRFVTRSSVDESIAITQWARHTAFEHEATARRLYGW